MASLSIPHSFTNNTVASATEVNANFASVKSFAESNVVQVDGSVQAGTTAIANLAVTSAKIADSAITSAKIADLTIVNNDIADNAITSAKILDNTIVFADLAATLQAMLVPTGTINAFAGSILPAGWLWCNGTSTAGYTALASIVGGTTPDLQGYTLVGKGSAPFDGALLSKFGSTTSTAPHTHGLASHTHSTAHTHNGYSGDNDADHTHDYIRTGQNSAQVINAADTAADVVEIALYGTDTSIQSRNHQHAITTTSQSTSTSGGPSVADSGASSAAATHGNVQPSALVNYIIKY